MTSRLRPVTVAHRGDSAQYPENSLAAFQSAWEVGGAVVECDVRLSRDGIPVVIHDHTTGRVGANNLVVAATAACRLAATRLRPLHHESTPVETIPLLGDILQQVPPGRHLYLECKVVSAVKPVCRLLKENRFDADRVTFLSFLPPVLEAVHHLMPGGARLLLGEPSHTPHQRINQACRCKATGLDLHLTDAVDEQWAQALRSHGLSFHVWTVDAIEGVQQALELGVDSITTNRPGWLSTVLDDLCGTHARLPH